MLLNKNTVLPAAPAAKPVQYALKALRRDFDRVFSATEATGGRVLLNVNDTLAAEQYVLTAGADTLLPMIWALSTACLRSAAGISASSRSGSGMTRPPKSGKMWR